MTHHLTEDERFRINLEGRDLEREGRDEEAAAMYEVGVAARTDTPATYERLAIVYRKLQKPDDGIRPESCRN